MIIYSDFMEQLDTVFERRERRYVLGYAIGTEVCLFFQFCDAIKLLFLRCIRIYGMSSSTTEVRYSSYFGKYIL